MVRLPERSLKVGMPCRNVAAKEGFPSFEGASTLYEVFERSVKLFGENRCLGWRPITDGKAGPYEYWTYKQTQGVVPKHLQPLPTGMKAMWNHSLS